MEEKKSTKTLCGILGITAALMYTISYFLTIGRGMMVIGIIFLAFSTLAFLTAAVMQFVVGKYKHIALGIPVMVIMATYVGLNIYFNKKDFWSELYVLVEAAIIVFYLLILFGPLKRKPKSGFVLMSLFGAYALIALIEIIRRLFIIRVPMASYLLNDFAEILFYASYIILIFTQTIAAKKAEGLQSNMQYSQPAFQQSFTQPQVTQANINQPVTPQQQSFAQPVYPQQQSFAQPIYPQQQPYAQPVYPQQQSYSQPVYQQPSHVQPAETQPVQPVEAESPELRDLKASLDAGYITQKEYELKLKEIMNG